MSDGLFSHCAPVLPVDNALETARFYEAKLGFEISFAHDEPPSYVILRRDGVSIHLSEREDTTKKIEPYHVYVFVSDVDAVYEEYRSKGLAIAALPEDQDYGMREFDMVDPNDRVQGDVNASHTLELVLEPVLGGIHENLRSLSEHDSLDLDEAEQIALSHRFGVDLVNLPLLKEDDSVRDDLAAAGGEE